MSRLYDTVEPSVVDEQMLQDAVEEQGPKEEAGRMAKDEGLDFIDVTELRLDFKNILKIDNLWCFKNLVKLQLDNNIIEKIEGLGGLQKLVWLDLSFNNIEVIEGLDKLVNLEDLTLYNNRISKLENMDSLTKLHVFSIGNNNLEELENLVYLRNFKFLQTLNVGGNHICEQEDYKSFVIAHLPALEYLDYRLIDEQSKKTAFERYEIAVLQIQQDEKIAERKALEQKEKNEEGELHKRAYVENLNGPHLFENMFTEDTEGQKLNNMPTVDELVVVYKEKFTVICQEIFEYGLKKHVERKEEVDMFLQCIEDAKTDNKDMGMRIINEFMTFSKEVYDGLGVITEQAVFDKQVAEYHQKVSDLWDTLMGYEMQLVDQLEETIKDFERNMGDMVGTFIEQVQGLMSQCRDLENTHHEKLLEIAIITLEKAVKNELEEDIPDDLRELLVDKDTIINAVTTSHDVHLLKIDNREDEMITRIRSWLTHLVDRMHENDEVARNRARVTEINNLVDHLRDEIDNLEVNVV